MSWVTEVIGHVLKALFFTVWGCLRTILRCFSCSSKKPDLSSDICLITGAGQGLGRQLALKMADCGAASLVLWDIDEEKVKSVAEELISKGHKAYYYTVDCSKREKVYKAAQKVTDEVGVVSVLVNNAGVVGGSKFLETADDSIERTFAVNTVAHYWTVKAFLPGMIQQNHGHIVSIASVMAFQSVPRLTDYSASKAAALSFAEGLRYELRKEKVTGVSVTAMCPYHITTQLFKGVQTRFPVLMRSLSPEEVASRTLQAMAERQFVVVLPKTLYLTIFLKAVLPTEAIDELLDAMGADIGMDTFVGRKSD